MAIHNRPKVGVVIRKWAWSIKFCARFARVNSIIIRCPGLSSHKLGNYACKYYLYLISCGVASTQKLHNTALNSCNFFVFFSRSCFFMVAKIYIITMAQRHQFLMNYFFIWYVHTRMYGEFFPEFFDLIISINQIFFVKNFQR